MSALKLFVPITKIDVEKRIVYGIATGETPDRSKEICDYASTKPHYEAWSGDISKASGGKSLGNLRAMHGKVAAGKVVAINCNDVEKQIEIAAHVVDDQEWRKVEEGVYTGFSQGGAYAKRWPDETNPEMTRYTAIPSEISLVDIPCLKTATFEVIKADGSTEMRKFVTVEAEPRIPTNAEVLEKAQELAKAAGVDLLDSHVQDARDALTAEFAKSTEKAAGGDQASEAETAALADALAKQQAAAVVPAANAEPAQVWLARDGSQHVEKALAVSHNTALDLKAAADAAAAPILDALGKIGASLGIVKGAVVEMVPMTKSELLVSLRKYDGSPGSNIWDSSSAMDALRSVLSVFMSEMSENEKDPAQLAALTASMDGLKTFITLELAEKPTPSPDDALTRAIECLGLAKRGARTSAKDKEKLQQAHDALTDLGADCSRDNCPDDDADKAHKHGDLAKVAGELAAMTEDRNAQKAALEKVLPCIEKMAADIELLKKLPVPPPRLEGTKAVDKGTDDAFAKDQAPSFEEQLAKMTPEELQLAVIKAAHRNPQKMRIA